MKDEKIVFSQNQFQSKYPTYHEWLEVYPGWETRKTGYDFIIGHILEYIGDPIGKKILDVGCGFGHHALLFAEMGANATALDVRPKEIGWIRGMKEKYEIDNLRIIHSELKEWYAENDEKVDYTLWMNVMHHIGLFDGREFAFDILNKMLDNSKAVFMMVRPYWTRSVGTWDIGRSHEEARKTLVEETGAKLTNYGAVPLMQGNRPLYRLNRD